MHECLCCGNDSPSNNVLINDLKTVLNTESANKLSDKEINLLTNRKHLNVQFNIARKLCRLAEYIGLQNATLNGDVGENRRKVIVLLLQSRSVILNDSNTYGCEFQKNVLQNVSFLQKSIQQVRLLTKETLNKLVSSSVRNNALPLSQYFHMYFDVRWLVLTIQYICNKNKESIDDILKETLLDLITIAQNIYVKQEVNSSPFLCTCIKQFWIALEYFIGFVYGSNSAFWNIFNKLLEEYDELFTLWLLYNLANLTTTFLDRKDHFPVEENGYIIEKKLKSILVNNSHLLAKALEILQPLITDIWLENAKLNIYQILWDYFFKQLNNLDTDTPNSVTDFIESIIGLTPKQSSNSYELFIYMLLIHLRKHTSHWSKLKGRIYSRFPMQKVSELNAKGIYNVCLLFLRLADVCFEELVEKMEELLKHISVDKNNELVFKIHISLISNYIHHEKDIENVSSTLLCLLEEASQNRNKYNLIKIAITGFDYILNMSSNYHLKQYKILGTWVLKYVTCCQYGDLCYLINILTWTVEKLQKTDAYFEWMPALVTFILPAMKQVATTSNAPPQSGRLIALIIQGKPALISQFVVTFTGDSMNPKVVNQFLCSLLEDYPDIEIITLNSELLIIRAWVRCALLTSEISDELTRKIFKFDYLSMLNINEISQDPLLTLIKAFSKQFQSSSDCSKLKEICQSVFGHINQVLPQTISKSPPEAIVLRIYNYISTLYFHCANLLYNNTKSNCLLSEITSIMLLPTEILMGRPPNQTVLKAIENTWHIFMEGLFKLYYNNDPYIERTLRDLVTKYIPHFSTTESPILKCLNKEDLLAFILDKIATTFLNNSTKASEENMFKALKTIETIVQATNDETVIKLIVQKILPGILEAVMFSSNKTVAINVLKSVALSEWYIHIRYDIRKAVQLVMEKHLAFAAHHFFQLFTILIKLIPDDVRALLPSLKKQIGVVERMRGVGFDNTLRTGLDRIEALM